MPACISIAMPALVQCIARARTAKAAEPYGPGYGVGEGYGKGKATPRGRGKATVRGRLR